jgi:hypothetical protein
MKHQLDCVKKFHQVYKLSFNDNPTSKLDP